jgi:hypothetical protein
MQVKGDYMGSNPLRSDVSQDSQARRLSSMSSGQKQLKGGHTSPLRSYGLMMARNGGWTA